MCAGSFTGPPSPPDGSKGERPGTGCGAGRGAGVGWIASIPGFRVRTRTVVPVELLDHEWNNTSTKGIGEPATVPAAAAIANAIYNATGVRVTNAPITAAHLVAELSKRNKRG